MGACVRACECVRDGGEERSEGARELEGRGYREKMLMS
jgi:hypothetical protein